MANSRNLIHRAKFCKELRQQTRFGPLATFEFGIAVNKLAANSSLTQICLRFKLDDNNKAIDNYLSLFSGNATNPADRPQMVIMYIVP